LHPDRLEAQDGGGTGLLFTPAVPARGGRGAAPTFVQCHTLHKALKKALKDSGLPALTWYQSTRRTFASQFVLQGGSIEKLSKLDEVIGVIATR
jgi:hypothetical protein